MNRKTIFGITALLAVIALGLAFTACPKDEDERSVTFINKTSSSIYITFQNSIPAIILSGATPTVLQTSATATKKGEDIILNTLVFNPDHDFDMDKILDDNDGYVQITGAVTSGKQVKTGLSLGYGTMIFSPKLGVSGNNPFNPLNKWSTIPQDDDE